MSMTERTSYPPLLLNHPGLTASAAPLTLGTNALATEQSHRFRPQPTKEKYWASPRRCLRARTPANPAHWASSNAAHTAEEDSTALPQVSNRYLVMDVALSHHPLGKASGIFTLYWTITVTLSGYDSRVTSLTYPCSSRVGLRRSAHSAWGTHL
jgi:hypothetical protein